MNVNGKITRIKGNQVTIYCKDVTDTSIIGRDVTVTYDDDKKITMDQRKKIFVMIHEFAEHTGNYGGNPLTSKHKFKEAYSDDYAEYILKVRFKYVTGYFNYFSFSDCSRELATRFIEFLIDICLQYGVNFKTKFIDSIRGNYKYEWYCYKNMCCEICGRNKDTAPIEIAHVHAVGMGRNRDTISHVGNRIMILCHTHHQYQHSMPIKDFMQMYQLKGIEVTPDVAKRLKLGHYGSEQDVR